MSHFLEARRRLKKSGHDAPKKKLFAVSGDTVDSEAWFEMNFERWYSAISDSTIATRFVDMPLETISAFQRGDPEALVVLEAEVDRILQTDFNGSQCFVKLSCRSPKDATVESPELEVEYRRLLAATEHSCSVSDNTKLQLLFRAHLSLLSCSSGAQAISLLQKSGRIKADLEMAIRDGTPLQLLIREWIDIPLSGEFRGFVFKRELTCVSQYFNNILFPELDAFDPAVLRRFYNEHIKERIQWKENFVIDFGVAEDGRIFVIELNPFLPTTDACCFNWSRDADIIGAEPDEGGTVPLVFRKRDSEIRGLANVVLSPWRRFFEE